MATENQQGDPATEATEMVTKDSQDNQDQSASETQDQDSSNTQANQPDNGKDGSDNDQGQTPKPDGAKQALLADLHKARTDSKAAKARVAELETQVTELGPVKETLDAVQHKYDRLEEFLSAAGGPLSQALDSRSFTKALFESDKPVGEIVSEWNKANPTDTARALGHSSHGGGTGKTDINDLLRAAAR